MKDRLFFRMGILFLLGMGAGLVPAARPAGRPETGNAQDIRHGVSVILKLVQVYVTDRDGKAVLDLGLSDFVLTDNGRAQKIYAFEPPRSAPRVAGEDARPDRPVEPAGPKLPRKFILYFDTAAQDQGALDRSKAAALRFIDTQLRADDELAVLVYSDNRQLVMVHYLTTDQARVRKAVEDLKPMIGRPEVTSLWFNDNDLGQAMAELAAEARSPNPRGATTAGGGGQTGSGEDLDGIMAVPDELKGLIQERRFQDAVLYQKHMTALVELRELAKALSFIPGYKNIIFFSNGLPNRYFLPQQDTLKAAARSLADANTRVFAVNTASDPDDPNRGELALDLLADATGGAYFARVGQAGHLAEEIQRLTAEYYVLAYSVAETWDGAYHRLRVEVKRPGCRVRAQEGFFNPKPFGEMSKTEKQLHLIDLALSDVPQFQTPLELSAAAVPARSTDGSLGICLAEAGTDDFRAEAGSAPELIALVINTADNTIVDSRKGDVDFGRIAAKRFYPYIISAVPPGTFDFRIVFRNPKTGRSARALARLVVPPQADGEFGLDDPLLLIPDTEAVYINVSASPQPALSLKSLFPVMPGTCAPVCEEVEPGTTRLLAAVQLGLSEASGRDLTVNFLLRADPDGETVSLPGSLLKAQALEGRIKAMLFEVILPPLDPGSYVLDTVCRNKVTGEQHRASRRFRVL